MHYNSQLASRMGYYRLNVKDGTATCSSALNEVFGFDPTIQMTLQMWHNVIHPDERQEVMDYLSNAVIREGRRFDKEYRIQRADDETECWVHGMGELEYDDCGRPLYLCGVVQDIHQRKITQIALAKREELFRQLLGNSIDMIAISDQTGQHISVYGSVERILGYRPEELVGTSSLERIHPDDRARVRATLEEGLKRPSPGRTVEYRCRRKDGSWATVEAVGTNRLADPSIGGIVITVRDVSERKITEDALRKSEERYRLVSDCSGQLVFDMDLGSGHMEWAGRIEELTGYSVEEFNRLATLGWESLIHPEDRLRTRLLVEAARLERRPYDAEFRHGKKDGSYFPVAVRGVFVYDDRLEAIRQVGSMRDETQRLLAAQQQEKLQDQLQQALKMEAVGRLAGGVAHDFNNLLTVILGNIELSQLDLDPAEPLAENLQEMNKAAKSAASLTEQLLAFSRRQHTEMKLVNLNELVVNLKKMLARLVGPGVNLETRLANALPLVKIDAVQFEQAVINLALNARDAMPSGGLLHFHTALTVLDSVRCRSHPHVRPGPFVLFQVSDSGEGMSDEVRSRIFEPFFTTKPLGRGTGLGLATAFGAIQHMGGFIDVDSEPGQGTTFRIYLPAVPENAAQLRRWPTTMGSAEPQAVTRT